MSDIRASIQELNSMVREGNALEAFEKFYADDIVMQEGSEAPTVGKDLNRQREIDFFSSVTEFRGAEVASVAVGEDSSAVQWHFDYTHEEWGDVKYDQVAVQQWRDGKIVHERFFKG